MEKDKVCVLLRQKLRRNLTPQEDQVIDGLSSRDRLRLWQMVDFDPNIDITKIELPPLPLHYGAECVMDEELNEEEVARIRATGSIGYIYQPALLSLSQRSPQPVISPPKAPAQSSFGSPFQGGYRAAKAARESADQQISTRGQTVTREMVKRLLQERLGRGCTRAEEHYIAKLDSRDCARMVNIIQNADGELDITMIELPPIHVSVGDGAMFDVNASDMQYRAKSLRTTQSPVADNTQAYGFTPESPSRSEASIRNLQSKINALTLTDPQIRPRKPPTNSQEARDLVSDADIRIAKLRERYQKGTGRTSPMKSSQPEQYNTNQIAYASLKSCTFNSHSINQSAPVIDDGKLYQQRMASRLGAYAICGRRKGAH